MEEFFAKWGRRLGSSVQKGKWYYKSAFGSKEEAIRAERQVGRELAANIRSENTIVDDAAIQKALDDIGGRLHDRVYSKQYRFQLELIASSDVNAFALPGGYIFMTWALYDLIKKHEDEIAFVLAHEIMHVVLNHPMKRIMASYSNQIIANIVMKGGVLGMLGNQITTMLLNSGYSRDNELEADNYAVRLMHSADFDASAATSLLNRLRESEPEDLPVYNYFLSHPPIDERIKQIDETIKERKLV